MVSCASRDLSLSAPPASGRGFGPLFVAGARLLLVRMILAARDGAAMLHCIDRVDGMATRPGRSHGRAVPAGADDADGARRIRRRGGTM
jgi:hypothetical protein